MSCYNAVTLHSKSSFTLTISTGVVVAAAADFEVMRLKLLCGSFVKNNRKGR